MPFDDGELQKLSAVRANRVLSDPVIAYGTTLIAAVLTSEYMSFMQIGDGDILIVDDRGGVSRPPLPHDARLLANQTTSLCGKEAWRDARSYLQPLATRPPALIMISTDGYANSFADDDGFYCAATDLLEAAQTTGIRKVGRQLPNGCASPRRPVAATISQYVWPTVRSPGKQDKAQNFAKALPEVAAGYVFKASGQFDVSTNPW